MCAAPLPPGRGSRRRAWVALTAATGLALAGCAGPAVGAEAPPATVGTAAWVTFQGQPDRNDVVATAGSGSLLQADWRFATGDSIVAAPSVVRGVAYLTSMDGRVYALDVATGRLLWSFRADNQIMSEALVVGGRVFFGSGNKGFTGSGAARIRGSGPSAVYALDARTGALLWRAPVRGEAMPTPAYRDGVVYEPTGSGTFYAFDAASGKPLWSVDVGSVVSMSSPVIAGDLAIFGGTGGGKAPAYDAVDLRTHRVAWSVPFPAAWGGPDDLSPTLAGRDVYVQVPYGSTTVTVGELALDARTGHVLWQRILAVGPPDWHGGEEAGIATVVGGVVYVGTPVKAGLWALDARTGRVLWVSPLPVPVRTAPTVVGDRVYVDDGGTVYALDRADGAVEGSLVVGHRPVETNADYVDIPCADPAVTVVGRTLLEAGGAQNALVAVPLAQVTAGG